jgi:hypothetical protein
MGNVDCPIGLDAHTIWLNARVPHCLDYSGDLSLRERQRLGQRPFVAEWTKEFLPNDSINITTSLVSKNPPSNVHHNINGTVNQDEFLNENKKLVRVSYEIRTSSRVEHELTTIVAKSRPVMRLTKLRGRIRYSY